PTLNDSTLSELREAGSRLTNEWKSKERDREAFWQKVTEDEEREDRNRYLKAAGEKQLKAAEGFLVAESQHFEMETAQLKDRHIHHIRENDITSSQVNETNMML
ncbi:hypothetical protein BGX21_004865, partial [Mortierella sp. AD011]